MAKAKIKTVPKSRFPKKPPSGKGKKAPTPTGKRDRRVPPTTAQLTNNLR